MPLAVGHLGRVIVDWMNGPCKGRYRGLITEWKTELGRKGKVEHIFCVLYDDTQQCEHVFNHPETRPWVLSTDVEEAQLGWQHYELACQISKQRLVTPARGSRCTHPALCNEIELRGYVGRSKKCPVFNCTAPLERTAAVVVETEMEAMLAMLPSDAQTFWYGPCGEVTHEQPSVGSVNGPRKRKRIEVKTERPDGS